MTVRRLVIVLGVLRILGALGVLGCAGCGDNLHRDDDPFTAVSGTRLALQKYRFDDGTEQVVANEFYDTQLHVRCAPRPWPDGAARCVPVADDVAYLDPACTTPVGLDRTTDRPTHFIAYDTRPEGAIVTRVYRAGAATAPITQSYGIVGGACAGPVAVPPQITMFFEVGDELDAATLVTFHDGEIAGGRLGLQLREADDGLRVPSGLRDRELDVACVARPQGDGRVVCEPTGAAAASYFADPACHEPVVAVDGAVVPALARVVEPSGCASYHRVGRDVSPPLYRREGDACTPADAPAAGRWFAVEAALALPALTRSVEDAPDRRLQRIILDSGLDSGGLRFTDDRLFDTTTGADCRARTLRDATRCIPVNVVPATTLLTDECTVQVRVVEVPQRTCEPLAFATSNRPFQVRPIGELASVALFHVVDDGCQAYASPPGTEVRDLGPPIDLTTFPSALYYSER